MSQKSFLLTHPSSFRLHPFRRGGPMTFPLSRRDLLKTLAAAGCLAVLPEGQADAGPGWIHGSMTGAQALVEALLCEGTDCVFGIPGAQCNEFWDAMKSK